jgi:hypothetical protein
MPRTTSGRYNDPQRGTRTRQETARLLGCGVRKVAELIRLNVLKAVPAGNRNLTTVSSIEDLLGKRVDELERGNPRPVPKTRKRKVKTAGPALRSTGGRDRETPILSAGEAA